MSDIIKVTEEGIRGNRAIFTVNMYRTKSSFLINGSQVQKFINEILPSIQSWAEENKREIKIADKKIEEKLKELTMVKYEQHEPNINNNTNIIENNETDLDFKIHLTTGSEMTIVEEERPPGADNKGDRQNIDKNLIMTYNAEKNEIIVETQGQSSKEKSQEENNLIYPRTRDNTSNSKDTKKWQNKNSR